MGDGEITLNVSKLLSGQLTYVATDLVDVIFLFCCVSFLAFFFGIVCLFISRISWLRLHSHVLFVI